MGLFNSGLHASYALPFRFTYTFFHWLEPLPAPGMYVLYTLFLILGVCILLGAYYRIATAIFAVGFAYSFLLTKEYYLNHGYLYVFICFLMALLPAHRKFSWDVDRGRVPETDRVAWWQVYLLPLLMGVVYFYGGLAKLQADWLAAKPLKIWLSARADYWLIGELLASETMAYFMAYGGLILDLSAPFLLLWHRTRVYVLVVILFFHLTNTMIFLIGIFPWMSIALSLMYFPASRFRAVLYRLRPGLQTYPLVLSYHRPSRSRQNAIIAVLLLFLGYHLLMPFRHHLYEGDVNWTEEGHRFSWRMMLRSKSGRGFFLIRANEKDSPWVAQPRDFLTPRQRRKLLTHPDMIYEFAQYLGRYYAEKGYTGVAVYAHVEASLNRRPFIPLVDAKVNLLDAQWSIFCHDEWIYPEPVTPETK